MVPGFLPRFPLSRQQYASLVLILPNSLRRSQEAQVELETDKIQKEILKKLLDVRLSSQQIKLSDITQSERKF